MWSSREKERAYWVGFRDALVSGLRDPTKAPSDTWKVGYDMGFGDGKRAVERIREKTG